MRRTIFWTAIIGLIFTLGLPGCKKGDEGSDNQNLVIPPPPAPPPQAQTPQPAQPAPQAPSQEELALHQVPPGAMIFDNFGSGIHQWILLERIGAGSRPMPTPAPVKFAGRVALKIPLRFSTNNHYVLYRKTADKNLWSNFKDVVAVIHGNDNVQVRLAFGVEQRKDYYFGWQFVDQPSSGKWSKVVYHLSDLVNKAKKPLPTNIPVDAIYLKFDRLPDQKPPPPVGKTLYIESIYLQP